MERITSLVILFSLLFISTSVMKRVRANQCQEGMGTCQNCDERCKAKHGPDSESNYDSSVGYPLCTCYFQCPPYPQPPRKMCNGGGGMCTHTCQDNCCNENCARKFNGGSGFCNTLGTYMLCQCTYPC
ncbi:unnamed protein product [Cochlearia groenlandica]